MSQRVRWILVTLGSSFSLLLLFFGSVLVQTVLVHLVRLRERKRLADKAAQPLPQDVVEAFDVAGLAAALACGLAIRRSILNHEAAWSRQTLLTSLSCILLRHKEVYLDDLYTSNV